MKKAITLLIIFVLFVAGYYIVNQMNGFTQPDIDALHKTIKDEFEKRPGVSVTDVQLLRESPRKLVGFVKLKISGEEITKSCSATMGDNAQYIWECN